MTRNERRVATPAHNQARVRLPLAALQLLALSFHPVISFWAPNFDEGLLPNRLLTIGALAFAASLIVARFLHVVLRFCLARALAVTSILLVGFFGWDLVRKWSENIASATTGWVGAVFAGLVIAVALWGGYFFARTKVFRVAALAFALSIFAVSIADLTIKHAAVDHVRLPQTNIATHVTPDRDLPDIYYIVLDAYAREDVLRDLYGFNNEAFRHELESLGFYVPATSVANYSMTHASIPSALTMNYVIEPGSPITSGELIALHRIIGGDNVVVKTLKQAGYNYWHLESNWGGGRCGDLVNRCLPAPYPDDGTWGLLERTPLKAPLERRIGRPAPRAALSALHQLRRIARRQRQGPRFIYAHVLLPHPPLLVDASCRLRFNSAFDESILGAPGLMHYIDDRRAAYVDQVRCVNRRVSEFLREVDPSSVVLLMADHGPDSLGQLLTVPLSEWSADAIAERMSMFAALRLPRPCRNSLEPAFSPVNSFRLILNCLLSTGLPELSRRSILIPPARGKYSSLEVVVPPSLTARP